MLHLGFISKVFSVRICVKMLEFSDLFCRSETDCSQKTRFWENTAVRHHHHLYRRQDHLPGSTFTLISASAIGDFTLHTLLHHVSKAHAVKTHRERGGLWDILWRIIDLYTTVRKVGLDFFFTLMGK